MIIRSRAPVRISFGGGGTDLPEYSNTYGGVALNITLNKFVYGTLVRKDDRTIKLISADYKQTREFVDLSEIDSKGDLILIQAIVKRMHPDYGFELFLRSDIPPNTGLGSSASVAVSIIGLFNHLRDDKEKLNKYEIAELAHEIETKDLGNKGGRQDQYAASFGGLNFMEFKGNDFVRINPLSIKKDHLLELEKHVVLVFVGKRPSSGKMQEELTRHYLAPQEEEKLQALHNIKELAYEMKRCLVQGRMDEFGELLGKEWAEKKKLTNYISNSRIESLYELAKKYGALGAKITGAGGGGCMIFYCKSNKEQEVANALERVGARAIDFSFDFEGLQTWEMNKDYRAN